MNKFERFTFKHSNWIFFLIPFVFGLGVWEVLCKHHVAQQRTAVIIAIVCTALGLLFIKLSKLPNRKD